MHVYIIIQTYTDKKQKVLGIRFSMPLPLGFAKRKSTLQNYQRRLREGNANRDDTISRQLRHHLRCVIARANEVTGGC